MQPETRRKPGVQIMPELTEDLHRANTLRLVWETCLLNHGADVCASMLPG